MAISKAVTGAKPNMNLCYHIVLVRKMNDFIYKGLATTVPNFTEDRFEGTMY